MCVCVCVCGCVCVCVCERERERLQGILKGGSISVLLTSCLTVLDWSVLQMKTKIVSCHTADSKLVKQEVNGTVILPPLVFPGDYVSSCESGGVWMRERMCVRERVRV